MKRINAVYTFPKLFRTYVILFFKKYITLISLILVNYILHISKFFVQLSALMNVNEDIRYIKNWSLFRH